MKSVFCMVLNLIALLAVSCDSAPTGRGAGEIATAAGGAARFRVETVATGLETPWSIVFAPDGRMFIAERPGRVRVIEDGKLRPEPLATIPDVSTGSESGLMGLALHPRFAENRLLYLSYSYRGDGKQARVVRFRETGSALTERKVIIDGLPAADIHVGIRLRFGPDGKLYMSMGDTARRELAQRLDSLAGKILRLNDDGTVPTDNPFVNQQGARPEIWSYGHRNPEGFDWQPGSDLMFDTDHGPSGFDGPGGGDEFNLVERGRNYGWPEIHHAEKRDGMESPLLQYTPAVAPASGMFYRGSAFPDFRGNYFFGALRGKCIVRVTLDGRAVRSQERLIENSYGRIRDVAEGPDGAIYFSTSNRDGRGSPAREDDRILRLAPAQ
jgi:glucose/arabinose dehydrogenase